MNWDTHEDEHEALGDRYLDLMKLHRVPWAPVVAWCTGELRPWETQAFILWDEPEQPELVIGARNELPELVACRVLARVGCRN